MRLAIRNIMNAVHCDEERAQKIEDYINEHAPIDWSECDITEVNEAAIFANSQLL